MNRTAPSVRRSASPDLNPVLTFGQDSNHSRGTFNRRNQFSQTTVSATPPSSAQTFPSPAPLPSNQTGSAAPRVRRAPSPDLNSVKKNRS